LIGTAVGALLGAVFVIAFGVHLLWFGIAIATTVLVCEVLAPGPSYRLGVVTVAIVMVVNNASSPWTLSGRRFLEVVLGIVVALMISAVPPKSGDNR
jgi:uncharacterized membrane protein YgaE (UPF0421/DUF939 family)